MLLVIASGNPYNSNYCTEDGQVIYKADAPFKLVGRTAVVSKIIPNDGKPPHPLGSSLLRTN
jgi:hypothetical protein